MGYQYIGEAKIRETLFNNADYLADFCEAGVISIEEFQQNFRTYLLNRNMENLRKAGHKIKPGAEIMGVSEVAKEYERGKKLLEDEAGQQVLEKSVQKMDEICSSICEDLDQLKEKIN